MSDQFCEIIIIDGESYDLMTEPLFEITHAGKGDALEDDYDPYMDSSYCCSANLRGYVGTWVLHDNKLWLRDIEDWASFEDRPLHYRERYFPDQQGDIFLTGLAAHLRSALANVKALWVLAYGGPTKKSCV